MQFVLQKFNPFSRFLAVEVKSIKLSNFSAIQRLVFLQWKFSLATTSELTIDVTMSDVNKGFDKEI